MPYILDENDYNMFCVVNFYRPLTTTPEEALNVLKEIEGACGLAFTGIVNNSNLGAETTAESIRVSSDKAEELCRMTGLPLVATTAEKSIATPEMVPVVLQKRPFEN